MANNGVQYELFVQKVQQALIDAQQLGQYRTISVQHNLKLIDKNGSPRQFDLYWEFEVGGHVYRNIIECKDYVNDIPIDKIDALAGKLKGFPELKGIIATRNGFQSGAIKQAEANGIDVIVVRDENPAKDWVSADGTPLIRTIVVDLNCQVPPTVLGVKFEFDKEWARAHGFSTVRLCGAPTEIFIDDKHTGSRRSIQKIVEDDAVLHSYEDRQMHSAKAAGLIDAYLELSDGRRVKVLGYELSYRPGYVIKNEIRVSPEVIGVVEFVNQKRKKIVLQHKGLPSVVEIDELSDSRT